jgi:hypothetical protein
MYPVSAVALTGSNQAVRATSGAYCGFTIRETAGAVAVVRIYDNATTNSGTLLEEIALAAAESAREYYQGGGVRCANGIYVNVVSGTVSGSIRIG